MTVNELIENLKELQDKGYGDYNVIECRYPDNRIYKFEIIVNIDEICIDDDKKEIVI